MITAAVSKYAIVTSAARIGADAASHTAQAV